MTGRKAPSRGEQLRRALLLLCTLALVASACGGKKAGEGGKNGRPETDVEQSVETGLDEAGDPVRGGKVVYGLEAETDAGWCLSESQLAISGIQVARTIYDTLTVPNAEGEYVGLLAESFEHNEAYDEWTFKLREGVKFHDGTDLDATVVKNNYDAFLNKYPGRTSTLISFTLKTIESVEVVDDLTVKFNMTQPWIAFPAFTYGSGRLGIMAQAQLDDADGCDSNLIGTGPFKLKEWVRNQRLVATANTDYWQEAPDGKPYPYLDEIEYRPIVEGGQRLNGLQSGDITAMHTSSATQILRLREEVEAGNANLLESDKFGEVSYLMMNADKAPFDDLNVRKAVQLAVDREQLNDAISENLPILAEGPYAPGGLGHLESTGWPKADPAAGKELIDAYKAGGGDASFVLTSTPDPEVIKTAELIQSQLKEIGLEIELKSVDQATLISLAIAGDHDAMLFRNHPTGDPDSQYVWWQSESVVNFGRIKSPDIDRLLEEGRVETDEAKRKEIYENLNREFTEDAWNIWFWYTPWAVGLGKNVHNVYGPDLPDGSKPNPGLAAGHSVAGMWTSDS